MSPQKKFQIALSAIVGLIAYGTIGFKLILVHLTWFESFYFTLITLTTVGFTEPPETTEVVRYFIASLIIFGVGTLGYALSSAAQAVIEFELLSTFGKRRMYKDINKLSGHYIVCGAGRVGAGVIRDISRRGHDLVVIEADETIADRLLAEGLLVLIGDATSEGVLKAAGIERACGIVCAVSSDPDNLYITLTARDLNKDVRIISRANDEAAVERLIRGGANKVVSPAITGSTRMAQMLLRPAVADFLDLATMTERLDLEIEQVEIGNNSPFIGRALKDTGIRSAHGVIVISISRADGTMIFNPIADTIIEERDALVVLGSHSSLEALEEMANPGGSSGAKRHRRH